MARPGDTGSAREKDEPKHLLRRFKLTRYFTENAIYKNGRRFFYAKDTGHAIIPSALLHGAQTQSRLIEPYRYPPNEKSRTLSAIHEFDLCRVREAKVTLFGAATLKEPRRHKNGLFIEPGMAFHKHNIL